MRVFVTGASGYIGEHVARKFRTRGHTVIGLVRSEESAKRLKSSEIIPLIGDIKDPKTYSDALHETEVWIHTAFDYSKDGVKLDRLTIDTFLKAAKKSKTPKSFIYTSGVWIYGDTKNKIVDEATEVTPLSIVNWRPSHEELVLNAASSLFRPVVVRPGCVYGYKGSLTSLWFSSAMKGKIEMVGDGKNYMSLVHVDDVADAYVKIAERELTSLILNVNDGSHFQVSQIVDAISCYLRVPKKELSLEAARKTLGSVADGVAVNQKVSNERIKRLLSWQPKHTSFLDNLPLHFEAWKANS